MKPHRAIGIEIRNALRVEGEISPYDFWKHYRPDVSYSYIRMVFWILRRLGLIEPSRKVDNMKRSAFGKVYYRMVDGREMDPCWASPQGCYKKYVR